jgi:hypothetical protein
VSGSPLSGGATGSRAAGRLAVGLGLLAVGLGAAALVLGWQFFSEGSLPPRVAEALRLTVGVPFAVMGALICARRPRNRIGWLMLAAGLLSTGFQFGVGYFDYKPPLPGRLLSIWVAGWILVPALAALMFLLLLYPTGRLASRSWRPVAWAAAAFGVLGVVVMALSPVLGPGPDANPIGLRGEAGEFLTKVVESGPALGSLLVLLLACLASLVVRFRRAWGVERQQLKWLVYAASLAAVTTFVLPVYWLTGGILSWLSVWAIPVAIGVAVLRYHLYDIDRLINRTLVYGLLTVLLGLGYAGVVLLLGQLFGGVGGEPPSWAIAGATLAVAALVGPARRRIQRAVDRRFNRRRHDAAKTVEAFSARLRDQVDLDSLTAELLAVVDQAMEPTEVSLWLRPQAAPAVRAAPAQHRTG